MVKRSITGGGKKQRPRITVTPKDTILNLSQQVTILHTQFTLYKELLAQHNRNIPIEYTYQELTTKIADLNIAQKAATTRLRTFALEGGKQIFHSLSQKQADLITFQTGVMGLNGRNHTQERAEFRKELKTRYPAFGELISKINTVYGERTEKKVKRLVRKWRANPRFHEFLDQLPPDYSHPIREMKGGKKAIIGISAEDTAYIASTGAYDANQTPGGPSIISTPMQN